MTKDGGQGKNNHLTVKVWGEMKDGNEDGVGTALLLV